MDKVPRYARAARKPQYGYHKAYYSNNKVLWEIVEDK